jgi:hypothetical protein
VFRTKDSQCQKYPRQTLRNSLTKANKGCIAENLKGGSLPRSCKYIEKCRIMAFSIEQWLKKLPTPKGYAWWPMQNTEEENFSSVSKQHGCGEHLRA